MTVKQHYIKWRRARVIDRGIANGTRLRELEADRAGIDGSIWPSVAHEIDLEIAARTRRADKYRDYLKNTEAL